MLPLTEPLGSSSGIDTSPRCYVSPVIKKECLLLINILPKFQPSLLFGQVHRLGDASVHLKVSFKAGKMSNYKNMAQLNMTGIIR